MTHEQIKQIEEKETDEQVILTFPEYDFTEDQPTGFDTIAPSFRLL